MQSKESKMAEIKHPKIRIYSYNILENYPDFLDLPWDHPFEKWDEYYHSIVEYEIGIHRNEVKFLDYNGVVYAFKELPRRLATHEFTMLKELSELEIPVVKPVGYVQYKKEIDGFEEEFGIIITEFLEFSIPFRLLFFKPKLFRYQQKMIKSISNLLVRLHIAKFYWGDCSLSNILFKRDAGELQAYLVDAETMDHYSTISDPKRMNDLDIMSENIGGDLLDIEAQNKLPPNLNFIDTALNIRKFYTSLWDILTKETYIPFQEKYKIRQKLEEIYNYGFTVKEYALVPEGDGNILRMQTIVTEKSYYKNALKNLTSIYAEETQAKLIYNNILEFNADIESKLHKTFPLKLIAHQWMDSVYRFSLNQINIDEDDVNAPQIFCQILEHKWLLSEKQYGDVGLIQTLNDYAKLDDVSIEKVKDISL